MKEFIDTQFTTVIQDGEESRVPDLSGAESNQDVQYSVYDREQNGGTGCLVRVTAPPAEMSNITGATVTTVVTDQDVLDDPEVPFGNGNVGLESLDQPDVEVDELLNEHTTDEVLSDVDKDVARIVLNWSNLSRGKRAQILAEYGVDTVNDLVEDLQDTQLNSIVNAYSEIGPIPDHIDTVTAARIATQRATEGNQVLQDQELTAMDKVAVAKKRPGSDKIPSSSRGESVENMSSMARDIVNGSGDAHDEMLDYIKGNKAGEPWK